MLEVYVKHVLLALGHEVDIPKAVIFVADRHLVHLVERAHVVHRGSQAPHQHEAEIDARNSADCRKFLRAYPATRAKVSPANEESRQYVAGTVHDIVAVSKVIDNCQNLWQRLFAPSAFELFDLRF